MVQKSFVEVAKDEFPALKGYLPLLARVHGKQHPELKEVRDTFKIMFKKFKKDGADKVILNKEFEGIRILTKNYSIPSDACGLFYGTYHMLETIDKAYHA